MGWDFSCPDWETRIREGRSLMPDLPLFRGEADLAVGFYDALCLPDVPGLPLLRDASGDWFREIVEAVFGSRDPETNFRYVREIFALVGKGNSKTTYGAALMLVALLMNQRPRAEFLFVAPVQGTAEIAFNAVVGMIESNPELRKRFHIREHIKQIRDRLNGAKLKVKTFDLKILTGPKPAGVLLDELHLLGRNAKTPQVIRQIRGGLEKVTEGFLIIITTQSDEEPAGAFKSELAVARDIRDGNAPGRMLPILYEFPEDIAKNDEKWQDPANWHMVMPNLGRSLQLQSLIDDWTTEKRKGLQAIQTWASQHLNIEIGQGARAETWAGLQFWPLAADKAYGLEDLISWSDVVVAGIDGGGLDDLFGVAFLGRHRHSKRWMHWGKTWAHGVVLQRRKDIKSKLLDFEKTGELVIVGARPPDHDDGTWRPPPLQAEDRFGPDGVAMVEEPEDIRQIADLVETVFKSGKLHAVGLDPMGVGAVVDALNERGIKGEMVVGISQGWKMTGAIKTAERKLSDGTLRHAGQAIMGWSVGNAKVVPAGNAITINKAVSGSAKIDPLMALFDAVALMSMNPESKDPTSVYENQQLRVI